MGITVVGRRRGVVTRGRTRLLGAAAATVATLAIAATAFAATVTVTVTKTNKKHQTSHVSLHKGDTLRIAFKGNWYDSGYAWKLTGKPSKSVFKYEGKKTKSPGKCCGFPETITYTYSAIGTGNAKLRYSLFGPGNKSKATDVLTVSADVG
jgi:predicted secreted protein